MAIKVGRRKEIGNRVLDAVINGCTSRKTEVDTKEAESTPVWSGLCGSAPQSSGGEVIENVVALRPQRKRGRPLGSKNIPRRAAVTTILHPYRPCPFRAGLSR